MISDNIEIAINHLIKSMQSANDEFERQKDRLINELNDFSDWSYLIDYVREFLGICEVNNDIHTLIEDADTILRNIKDYERR